MAWMSIHESVKYGLAHGEASRTAAGFVAVYARILIISKQPKTARIMANSKIRERPSFDQL